MPNQRKKSKAMIGGFVNRELAEKFKAAAKARGMTAEVIITRTGDATMSNNHHQRRSNQ